MERPYPIAYAGTQVDDADTDGDGVLDGADDQDHDDVPNLMELSRSRRRAMDDATGSRCRMQSTRSVFDETGLERRRQARKKVLHPLTRAGSTRSTPACRTGFAHLPAADPGDAWAPFSLKPN